MTQVWMLRNSDTDIHVFNREAHLEPSVRISYSRCNDVVIKSEFTSGRELIFTVTGKRGEETFEDIVVFKCLPVWTEPCHL